MNHPAKLSAELSPAIVALAEQAGERTSCKETVAACIVGGPHWAKAFVRGLRLYR